MAHKEQRDFMQLVKSAYPNHFTKQKVLEIGSLNINGTVRDFFEDCDYVGIDVGPGPGVDVVCQGQKYSAPNDSQDVCISAECFEHNPYWVATFQNMFRMCRPGGLVIMTCASTGRGEHGTPATRPGSSPLTCELGWSYYKNLTEEDFIGHFDIEDMFSLSEFLDRSNTSHKDLFFWGLKK